MDGPKIESSDSSVSDVELDYDYLTQQALKSVVRNVLELTAQLGEAPGQHHFFIEFDTRAPGVSMPDSLIEAYPDRMTIVLQHQFGDLQIREDGFAVTLWFNKVETRLDIPFDAITSFADPSVQFGMRFDSLRDDDSGLNASDDGKEAPDRAATEQDDESSDGAVESPAGDAGADVVELDAFRKK